MTTSTPTTVPVLPSSTAPTTVPALPSSASHLAQVHALSSQAVLKVGELVQGPLTPVPPGTWFCGRTSSPAQVRRLVRRGSKRFGQLVQQAARNSGYGTLTFVEMGVISRVLRQDDVVSAILAKLGNGRDAHVVAQLLNLWPPYFPHPRRLFHQITLVRLVGWLGGMMVPFEVVVERELSLATRRWERQHRAAYRQWVEVALAVKAARWEGIGAKPIDVKLPEVKVDATNTVQDQSEVREEIDGPEWEGLFFEAAPQDTAKAVATAMDDISSMQENIAATSGGDTRRNMKDADYLSYAW
ncbi:hypothetical protein C8F01DRAFT_1377101 [Mycena amicta]|nr:hypothetical protein C8F01DRAFT_1377101 [Mycena amicta]